jgi:hypothetical protein
VDDVNVAPDGRVSLELGIAERGETTKTGTNQGVIPVHPALHAFYRRRKAESEPGARVFRFNIDTYRSNFNKEMETQGMEERGVHLLRHTCAVWLLEYEGWERNKVRDMGRWRKDRSLSMYGKRHLLLKNEGRLSKAQTERGFWMWEDPAKNMGFKDPTPAPRPKATAAEEATPTVSGPVPTGAESTPGPAAARVYPDLDLC